MMKQRGRTSWAAQVCVVVAAAAGILCALWAASEVSGQVAQSTQQRRSPVLKKEALPKVPAKDPKAESARGKGSRLPEPEVVALETLDGVRLSATYYRSKLGASAVPVLLLHGREGTQRDWKPLADRLQENGYAVLTFDFRGYGDSRKVNPAVYRVNESGSRKAVTELNPQIFRREDYLAMLEDVETAKRFLVQRHNGVGRAVDVATRSGGGADAVSQQTAELNIAKLTVVGAELGATIGAMWAERDWSWPDLAFGGRQGRDAIALVLISPAWNLPRVGLSPGGAVTELRTKVPMMILVGGKNLVGVKDARRLFDVAKMQASENRPVWREYLTELVGTKMLGLDLGVETDILEFLRANVLPKSVPWEKRQTPQ